ncbi:UNVERIFIED_CONTAM: hypothetical protein FKN15_036417 [Acipenser sinensis]
MAYFECEKEKFSEQALVPASGRMRLGFQGFSLVRTIKQQAAAAYTAVYRMCFMEKFSEHALVPASGRMRLGFQGFSLVRTIKQQAAAVYTAVYRMCFMMESLFGSLPEMLDFQKVFLQTLEERIASSPDFSTLETPFQFKVTSTFYLLFQ